MVRWLGLPVSNAGGTGLIPGRGTEILHAAWHGKKRKGKKKRALDAYLVFIKTDKQHSMLVYPDRLLHPDVFIF